MAQKRRGLNAKQIEHLSKLGLHAVGDGLYLRVKPTGSKFWAFRYMLKGRAREMGLGTYPAVSLDEVRHGQGKLADCQKLLRDGIDPIETRKQKDIQAAISQARHTTFRQCAEAYIHAHKTSWQNAKHLYQWNARCLNDFALRICRSIKTVGNSEQFCGTFVVTILSGFVCRKLIINCY